MTETYTMWLTIAVVIGALALAAQGIVAILMYSMVSKLQKSVEPLIPQARTALDQANVAIGKATAVIDDSRGQVQQVMAQANQISGKANEVMDMAKGSVTRVEALVTDVTERARTQMDHVESLMDESIGRTRHTVAMFNDTATRPIREVNAVSAGVKAAIQTFFSRRHQTATHEPSPNGHPAVDEETITR